ncbi:MAG: rhomboid family intramembrane serine protease [Gammaproteobacteria bacterium]|nr:MAG: rhomboid family intramembrane serine protease [Gammaproteobacteria bacterium]
MNFEYTALSVDIAEDILPLSAVLHQRGLLHRIYEENGRQVLKVSDQALVEEVNSLYSAWRSGQIKIELVAKQRQGSLQSHLQWRNAPATLVLVLLSIVGFGVVYFPAPTQWMAQLTFTPFVISAGQIQFYQSSGEYWRLITPVFLHFGWLHIVFNSLWLWELGAKVERVMGSLDMILLFFAIAFVSNLAQYAFGGPSVFGGMSGVVYGLLGFSWVGPLLQPRWQIQPPRGIMIFMVGWLVLCLFGIVEVLGFGAVANAAHVGGLLVGAILGAAFALLSRMSVARD